MSQVAHELPIDEIEAETNFGSDQTVNREGRELVAFRKLQGEDPLLSRYQGWFEKAIEFLKGIPADSYDYYKSISRIKVISTANDLPECPGGRYRKDGPNSAEEFRDEYLVPVLRNESDYDVVVVNFDGVAGIDGDFLDEAFGGLVRKHEMDRDFLYERMMLWTSKDELRDYIRSAWRYILLVSPPTGEGRTDAQG